VAGAPLLIACDTDCRGGRGAGASGFLGVAERWDVSRDRSRGVAGRTFAELGRALQWIWGSAAWAAACLAPVPGSIRSGRPRVGCMIERRQPGPRGRSRQSALKGLVR